VAEAEDRTSSVTTAREAATCPENALSLAAVAAVSFLFLDNYL